MTSSENIARALEYLRALEEGNEARVAELLHPDVRQQEFPNRLLATGAERGYVDLLDGMRRGALVTRDQHYEVVNTLSQGDTIVLEVNWSATLNVSFGDTLPAGSTMRARFAVFLEMIDGRIIRQRNYDCFDPW